MTVAAAEGLSGDFQLLNGISLLTACDSRDTISQRIGSFCKCKWVRNI